MKAEMINGGRLKVAFHHLIIYKLDR